MHSAMTNRNGRQSISWTHEVKLDNRVQFRTGTRGTGLVAEWPGLGKLACRRDGSSAKFTAYSGVLPQTIGKLQRGQVRALLCDLRGGLAVHASAVAVEGRAVLFVGSSGAGKSTAAAHLCLAHGAQLLADDATLIEVGTNSGSRVLPCEDDLWLTPDSCFALGIPEHRLAGTGNKRFLRASNVAERPWPLSLVVVLRFEPSQATSTWRPLRGGDAALSLLAAAFRFDVEDAAARKREFEQVTTVYRHVPFVEWVRGRGGQSDVATLVLAALALQRKAP
jgi:hypothetical protein